MKNRYDYCDDHPDMPCENCAAGTAWLEGHEDTIKEVCYMILGMVMTGKIHLSSVDFHFLIKRIKALRVDEE